MSTHHCYNYTPLEADALIIDGDQLPVFEPVVRNWADFDVHHFERPRNRCRDPWDVDAFVIHETDSMRWNAQSMQAVQNRGEGVHFAVLRDGTVYQHNDPVHRLGHARPHNARSIGVEIVNQPDPAGSSDPRLESTVWNTEGPAPDRPYRLPTEAQLRATHQLVSHFTIGGTGSSLTIPLEWPAVINDYYVTFPIPAFTGPGANPVAGVVAHGNVANKVDGLFPALYLWLRVFGDGGRGLGHADAWHEATTLAGDGLFLPNGALPGQGLDGRPAIDLVGV